MAESRSIAANTLSTVATTVGVNVMIYCSGALAARAMGPDHIGIYYWCASLTSYGSLMTTLALPWLGRKEIALRPNITRPLVSLIVSVQLTFAVITYIVGMIAALSASGWSAEARVLAILGLQFLVSSARGLWVLQSHQRMVAAPVFGLMTELAVLYLVFLLVRRPEDLYTFAAINTGAMAAKLVFEWAYLARTKIVSPWNLSFRLRGMTAALRQSLPIAISLGSILIYNNIDAVIIGLVLGHGAVGQYATAYSLMLLLSSPAIAIATAFQPFLTRSRRDGNGKTASQEFHRLLTWAGALITYFVCFWSKEIYFLVYGAQYSEGAAYFSAIAPNIFLIFISVSFSYPLMFWGMQTQMMRITLCTAAVNLAGNLILVPLMGVPGAIYSTLSTELLALALTYEFRRRKRVDSFSLTEFIVAAACVAGLLLISYSGEAIIGKVWTSVFGLVGIGMSALILTRRGIFKTS